MRAEAIPFAATPPIRADFGNTGLALSDRTAVGSGALDAANHGTKTCGRKARIDFSEIRSFGEDFFVGVRIKIVFVIKEIVE